MYIDDDAEWTYGNVRPLYHARRTRCHSCPSGGRFVPLYPDITFICYPQFTAFQVGHGKYDMAVKEAMLDDWPSSSAEPRWYRKDGSR